MIGWCYLYYQEVETKRFNFKIEDIKAGRVQYCFPIRMVISSYKIDNKVKTLYKYNGYDHKIRQ